MNKLIRKTVRELESYTPGEQPRGGGFTKLNTNENAYPPSPRVARLLARYGAHALRLYPDPVCLRLRQALGRRLGCAPERIFVGNGSDEVLRMAVQAFTPRGGCVGYFEPSYSLYSVLARAEGLATRPVCLPPDFTWRMPRAYRADLFMLANPNAPTGIQYPKAEVRAFCRRFPGVVLIDEAYVDFADDNCLDLARQPNVVVARTLSKSFSLAGLRLGYVVGPAALIAALYKIKDSYNVDRLAQEIALAAVGDWPHMRRNVERIKATRAQTAARLAAMGFTVFPSATNFLWVQPPFRPARAVFEELRRRRILVRYFPGPLTGAYLRITIGTPAQMAKLMGALAAILGGRAPHKKGKT